MNDSKLIAALTGPLLVTMGASAILNREMFPKLAQETGLIFLTGILLLLAGLAIVRVHNVWSGGWPVIITVLGWLAVVGGVVRMLFPEMGATIVEAVGPTTALIAIPGVVMIALGLFLSLKGYTSD